MDTKLPSGLKVRVLYSRGIWKAGDIGFISSVHYTTRHSLVHSSMDFGDTYGLFYPSELEIVDYQELLNYRYKNEI